MHRGLEMGSPGGDRRIVRPQEVGAKGSGSRDANVSISAMSSVRLGWDERRRLNPEPAGGIWPSTPPGIAAAGSPARIELSVATPLRRGHVTHLTGLYREGIGLI